MQARSRGPFSIGRWTWSFVERRLFNEHYCSQLLAPQKKKREKRKNRRLSVDCRSTSEQSLTGYRQSTLRVEYSKHKREIVKREIMYYE